MSDAPWKTILTESMRQAKDGSLDRDDALALLRALLVGLEAVEDSGVLPDRLWVRLAMKGAMAVLSETVEALEAQTAEETTPEPIPVEPAS